jgi:predicted HAD superfamily Cof-like phosphohydrolase
MFNSSSDYDKVLEFTKGAKQAVTNEPTPLNKDETFFLIRMLLSEVQELALTVTNNVDESVELLQNAMLTIDKSNWEPLDTDTEICAAQVDSVVDMWYYSLNAFCKKCIDPSAVFNVVQDANMAKRDPSTGKFNIRESDGKIIKPEGWVGPDIIKEIKKQIRTARSKQCVDAFRVLEGYTGPLEMENVIRQRASLFLHFIQMENIGCPTLYYKDDFLVISWPDINIYIGSTVMCILNNEFKYIPITETHALKLIEKMYINK